MAKKTRQVVAVDWLDAAGSTEWSHEDDAATLDPPLCTTVGVILSQTRKRLVIAGTVGHGDDQVGDVNMIPAGMIRAIRPLGVIAIEEEAKPTKKARTRSSY